MFASFLDAVAAVWQEYLGFKQNEQTSARPCSYHTSVSPLHFAVPNPRASFFTDSRGPRSNLRTFLRHPIDETLSPVKNAERPPVKNRLANPKCGSRRGGGHIWVCQVFFPRGPPEFYTGAGASSRGCRENFRRGLPGPRGSMKQ
jgi:hypothetical protein